MGFTGTLLSLEKEHSVFEIMKTLEESVNGFSKVGFKLLFCFCLLFLEF